MIAGFNRVEVPGGALFVCTGREDDLAAAGLDAPDGWEHPMLHAEERPGRGRTARLDLPGGGGAVLKRMRRGGLLSGAWRDRFPGTGRLLANLAVPMEAIARGVPTPEPLAMLVMRAGGGLFRAWLAVEEVTGSVDLLTRMRRPPVPTDKQMRAVLRTVRRMHDAGLHHRDLNLANLLVLERDGGWDVHVIDLDRAVLRAGPLSFRRRLSSLRRLERSYLKHVGPGGPLGEDSGSIWYRLYAGEDRSLAARLERSRPVGRLLLALHRLGW